MSLSPYISFAGNCADAIAYYQKTLGAELLYKISFGEMPKPAQDSEDGCPYGMTFPDTAIAHANVHIANSDIMMSDSIPTGNAHYSGFTLVLDTQNVNEGLWQSQRSLRRTVDDQRRQTTPANRVTSREACLPFCHQTHLNSSSAGNVPLTQTSY